MNSESSPKKIAILDDYQNVALKMADWSGLAGRADITVSGLSGSGDQPGQSNSSLAQKNSDRFEGLHTRKFVPILVYEKVPGIKSLGCLFGLKLHDSRSHRDLAIKFFAERFSNRFEREARALAPLNDPSICMVECESRQGLRPLDETLRIIRQIATV